MIDQLFKGKEQREKVKEDAKVKSYRNTLVSGGDENPQKKANKRERMKIEVEQKKEEYDFKYIKRQFEY